jgi:hypothetical protein
MEAAGIENLALEIKLTDVVTLFFKLTDDEHQDPVRVRKDILDGMLKYKSDFEKFEDMEKRVERAVGVTPDGADEWNKVIRFCMAKSETEPVEKYGEWMRKDIYNSPKVNQIAIKPALIISTWASAFSGVVKSPANKPNRAPMQG